MSSANDGDEVRAERDAPIQLLLRCTECGHAERRGMHKAFVAPDPAVLDAEWDGVVLLRIIRCGKCGAEDCYRVDAADVDRLRRRAEPKQEAVVVLGLMSVLDGRCVRRPSEAVRLLEDHLRAAPHDPVRWHRLANIRRQIGDVAGAEAGWRKVHELQPDDLGTAISIAHLTWKKGEIEKTLREVEHALTLLPRLREWESSPLRLDTDPDEIVGLLLDVLGGLTDEIEHATLWLAWTPEVPSEKSKEVVVTMSTLYLADLQRWDRLHEFLLSCSIAGARLAFEPPDELSHLQRTLDKPAMVWVSSSAKKNKAKRRG